MDADTAFARCAVRRRAVADLIDSLDDAQLATPSLCEQWDVRTVAGHLLVPLIFSVPRVAVAVARAKGNYSVANTELARRAATEPVSRMTMQMREHALSRFTPPLHGPAAPLTDLCVHTADMLIPLGRAHDITVDEAASAFDLLSGFSTFFIPRGLLGGIRIEPDETDQTWGTGDAITGPAGDVLLAVMNRAGFLDAVRGPGRDVLAQRCRRES